MIEGWVKLHRKILEWDYISDPNKFLVFVHLLLRANSEDSEICKRGQVIISVRSFAKEIGLSYQTLRTVLKHLTENGELTQGLTQVLTQGLTQTMTIITICKYDIYQSDKKRSNARSNADSNARSNAEVKEKESSSPDFFSPCTPLSFNPINKEKEKEKEELKKTSELRSSEKEKDIAEFERFNEWLDANYPNIRKMDVQLTIQEYIKIRDEYGKEIMIQACDRMENWKGLSKNCRTVNLTMRQRIRDIKQKQNGTGTQSSRNNIDAFGHDINAQQERFAAYAKMQQDILGGGSKYDDPYFKIPD